ncbi:hypothetical protein VP01_1252g3 [Puccinia sorghi]|uniref:Uncharacterized protein n=1 Tax=Puccinia sorghi TaxID=27349 RepID=A0A0L6VQW2_9BASI|nr:hypothetical protein VP01_1252g3 [Puccinia sorghi]
MVLPVPPAITGLQLLNTLKTFEPFSTGHRKIDCQLWSRPLKRNRSDSPPSFPPLTGLSRRQLLQIDGPPGSGKTKLLIGLAVRARTASLVRQGGNEPVEVLFIGKLEAKYPHKEKSFPQLDCDGSLHPTLIKRSANALVQSCYQDEVHANLVDRICDGCHLVRITSTAELGFFFRHLPTWLESHPKVHSLSPTLSKQHIFFSPPFMPVKLVILDSITAHTRYVCMSISQRKIIAKIIKEGLTTASSQHDCAVRHFFFFFHAPRGVISNRACILTSQLATKSVMNQGTYANMKILTPPDFGPNFWSKDESPIAPRSLSSKVSRICLMFNLDGTRRAMVLENDKIVQPRCEILFEIDPRYSVNSIAYSEIAFCVSQKSFALHPARRLEYLILRRQRQMSLIQPNSKIM